MASLLNGHQIFKRVHDRKIINATNIVICHKNEMFCIVYFEEEEESELQTEKNPVLFMERDKEFKVLEEIEGKKIERISGEICLSEEDDGITTYVVLKDGTKKQITWNGDKLEIE